MGFSRHQAESAIKKFGSVPAALDSLLAGVGEFVYNARTIYVPSLFARYFQIYMYSCEMTLASAMQESYRVRMDHGKS